MPRVRPVVIATAASSVLATVAVAVAVAAPSAAAHATAAHTPRPAPVRDLATYVAGDTITVDWKNPGSDFDRVVVRYRKGSTAPTISTGSGVHLDTAHARSATLRNLAADTRYSVAVWTKSGDKASDKRTTTFTTDEADAGNGTYVETVTDASGTPLEHVAITLLDEVGDEFSATTSSAGQVTRVLPSGHWLADLDGSKATGGDSDATGYVGGYDFFRIRAGRTAARPPIALAGGAALTGRVTNSLGKPLAGVVAYVAPPRPYALKDTGSSSFSVFVDDSGLPVSSVSAADGSYTLRGLPTGALQVCFDPTEQPVTGGSDGVGGYLARCESQTVDLAAGVHTSMPDTQLRAGTGGALVGRVTTPSGKGARSVIVEAFRGNGAGGAVQTDADGGYRFSGLEPGRYDVCFIPSRATTTARTGLRVSCPAQPLVIAASTATTADSALQHGGAITGTVTGPGGRPLEGVNVYARHGAASASTDSRGQYTLGGLGPMAYRICFDTSPTVPRAGTTGARPGCAADKLRVSTRRIRTGGDIELNRGGAVTGVITNSAGTPVRASVDLEPVSFENPYYGAAATDKNGRYVVGGVPAGRYRMCVLLFDDSGDSRTSCHQPVVVTDGQFTDVDKTLPPMGTVTVTAQDADADPIAGVDVVVLRDCTSGGGFDCDHVAAFGASTPVRVAATDMTSGDGTASFSLLKPGSYGVCLLAFYASTTLDTPPTGFADACTSTSFDVTVTADATAALTQTLQLGGVVTGKVTDNAGHPLRGALVHVSNSAADDFSPMFPFRLPGDPSMYSKTAGDGTYTIRSITPGSQTVCVDAANARGGDSDAGYLDQCIGGDAGTSTGGSPVSVKAGKTTVAPDLALTSAAGISGEITSSGKLHFAEIVVFDSAGSIIAEDAARGNGTYKVTGLPAGTDRVCVDGDHDSRCYVDAAWTTHKPPADATPVTTTAGALSAGIDVNLHG